MACQLDELLSCGNSFVWHCLLDTALAVGIELAIAESLVAHHVQQDCLALCPYRTEELMASLYLFALALHRVGFLGLRDHHNSAKSIGVVGGDDTDEATCDYFIE